MPGTCAEELAQSAAELEALARRARRSACARHRAGWRSAACSGSSRAPIASKGAPGVFELDGDQVTFRAEEKDGWTLGGAPVSTRVLASDKQGKADRLARGSIAVQVIDRGGKLGLRSWDAESAARRSFGDVETFPVDPRWRLEARWEPYAVPREVLVPSVIGVPTKELAPGRVHFSIDGAKQTLEPVLEDGALFFVFKDKTAPRETYGGGRFLYAEPAKDGVVRLDFNRAMNPPCVFTNYATCPLPLPQNQLPIRVEAGEKVWGHGHAAR